MSTQSPTPPPPPQSYGPQYGASLPQMPTPTSELVFFLLVLFVIGLIVLIADDVGPQSWVTAATALTIGYMLSRGIAKLGKVLENR